MTKITGILFRRFMTGNSPFPRLDVCCRGDFAWNFAVPHKKISRTGHEVRKDGSDRFPWLLAMQDRTPRGVSAFGTACFSECGSSGALCHWPKYRKGEDFFHETGRSRKAVTFFGASRPQDNDTFSSLEDQRQEIFHLDVKAAGKHILRRRKKCRSAFRVLSRAGNRNTKNRTAF